MILDSDRHNEAAGNAETGKKLKRIRNLELSPDGNRAAELPKATHSYAGPLGLYYEADSGFEPTAVSLR